MYRQGRDCAASGQPGAAFRSNAGSDAMTAKTRSAEELHAIATAKELRARDAELAMREYRLEQQALAARTEKLRALRLARERETSPQSRAVAGKSTARRAPARQSGNKS
jgi:hypothetical protein